MKRLIHFTTLILLAIVGNNVYASCESPLDFEARKLHSQDNLQFCDAFAGKVLLVVNTASECGFTPQFKELEALYKKYKDQNFAIVGFPSNDFNQEHKEESKTADVCYVNYGVTFPMLATSKVKGEEANDFFKYLIAQTGKEPSWNFNKYLLSADGKSAVHFGSRTTPLNSDLENQVAVMLDESR
jgi:glutathione peroxidase